MSEDLDKDYGRLVLRGKVMTAGLKTNEELVEIVGGCIPSWKDKEFNDLRIVSHLNVDEKHYNIHHYSFEIYEDTLPVVEEVLFVIWKPQMDDVAYSSLCLTLLGLQNQPGVQHFRFDDGMSSLFPLGLVQQTEIK